MLPQHLRTLVFSQQFKIYSCSRFRIKRWTHFFFKRRMRPLARRVVAAPAQGEHRGANSGKSDGWGMAWAPRFPQTLRPQPCMVEYSGHDFLLICFF
jgi:hypothetical protein